MTVFSNSKIVKYIFGGFKKSKIKAVYDDDLNDVLSSLGVLDKFKRGEAVCIFCGSKISFENLEVILKENNEIKFICSKQDCVSKI